jgi:hypothetical protein
VADEPLRRPLTVLRRIEVQATEAAWAALIADGLSPKQALMMSSGVAAVIASFTLML